MHINRIHYQACLCLASCALAALLLAPATAGAAQKVGFVNPQRVINESDIGSVAQQDLTRLGEEKDRAIRKSAEEINALQLELEQNSLSPAERQLKQERVRLLVREHEVLVNRSNEEIKLEEAKLIQFIMKKADVILRDLAQRLDYSMIITDPNVIGYIDASVDLTDKVIAELNKLEKK